MRQELDGLTLVRSRLADAVDRLERDAPRLSDRLVARRIAAIESEASAYGMSPLAAVARHGLHAAALPGFRTSLACHLERMEDAIGCRPLDRAGTDAIMASIALRLA